MKKVLSLLLVSVLAVGNVGFAATPAKTTTKAPVVAEVTKTAIVTGYTSTSVTVLENGKNVTYKMDAKTKVTRQGMEAMFEDIAGKGHKVTYKAKGTLLTSIDFPGVGQETQGIPTPFMITDIRENTTDDAALPANSATTTYKRTEVGVIPSEDFTVSEDGLKINIGQFTVVPESIKLSVGDKAIKMAAADFDKTADNDEAKLVIAKDVASIQMEKALTADEQKTVKLTYDRKNYNLVASEVSNYVPAEDVYAELNGKAVSYAKALNRSNFAYVTTNTKGEVVYFNAFYKELTAKFVKADKNGLTFNVERNGAVAFTDTLKLDAGVTILDKDGAPVAASKIKAGSEIVLTVDPGMNYTITFIQVK